jgi:competence protein ComEA
MADRSAGPAAALSLGLLLLALPGAPPAPAACPAPREVAPGEVRCDGPPRLSGAAALLFGEPLDPNRAPAVALAALPGIGPGRAEAILRERAIRPFCRIEDLERVPGIGPRTLARMAPFLAVETVGGPCADPGVENSLLDRARKVYGTRP